MNIEQNEYISILDLLKSFPEWLECVREFHYEEHIYKSKPSYESYWKTVDPLQAGYSDFCYSAMNPLPSYYKTIEEIETAMVEEDKIFVLEIPYCSGSDYSGSLVEVSNFKAMKEEYEDIPGLYTFYGDHGTFSIAMDLRMIILDGIGEIEETLRGLENYPLVDEGLYSNLEVEQENEQWESDGRSDFLRALEDSFSDFLEEEEHILQWYHGYNWSLSDIDEKKIDEYYYKQREDHSAYPFNECGSDIYFPFDFTEKIDIDSFKRFISYPPPLTIREYHQQDTFKSIENIIHSVSITPMVKDRDLKLNIIQGIVGIIKGYTTEQEILDIVL